MTNAEDQVELTADIVSAYVANNPVPSAELAALIGSVHASLSALAGGVQTVTEIPQQPAVNPRKSVTPDYIVCLEDGKKFKSLKRHLGVHYNMTPAEYRQKWNLPADYPMTAPNYSTMRSELAKSLGLGRKAPKKRGRPKKKA